MEISFWGRNCECGEEFVLGEEASDVLSNVSITGAAPVTVYVDDQVFCTVTPEDPNRCFRKRMPFDTPTRIRISGGSVDLCGYTCKYDFGSAVAELEKLERRAAKGGAEEPAEAVPGAKRAAAAAAEAAPAAKRSPKAAAQASPKVTAKASPKEAAKAAEKKKAAKKDGKKDARKVLQEWQPEQAEKTGGPVELTYAQVMEAAGVEPEAADEVDVQVLVLNGKEYFIDYRDFKVYSGDEETPKFEGYYHYKTKSIKPTPPDHTLDDSAVAEAAVAREKKVKEELRKQWEAEHPNDDDDEATIDSEEDEKFAKKSAFLAKREEEAAKKTTVFRGNDQII